MKTIIWYTNERNENESLIEWEMPHIPRQGEIINVHIPGLGNFIGTVYHIRYDVTQSYVCNIYIAGVK